MPLTFVHSGEFILEDGQLVDFAKLLEHGAEIGLLEITRDLTHEEFDGLGLFVHGR